MSRFTTRFAPSPTGYLHLGHAFAALTAAQTAAEAGGRFLLRIEDIDANRCRPEFDAAIQEDLAWLGLSWETPVRRQSEHLDDYQVALAKLRDQGLLYRCFKTRREVLDDIARAPHRSGEGADGTVYRGAPLPVDEEAELLAQGRLIVAEVRGLAPHRRLPAQAEPGEILDQGGVERGAAAHRVYVFDA